MKKLAAAGGGKSAQMMKPPEAERVAGFKIGGIGPFGQRRLVRTVVEQGTLGQEQVYINGGQRGLAASVQTSRRARRLKAVVASVVA